MAMTGRDGPQNFPGPLRLAEKTMDPSRGGPAGSRVGGWLKKKPQNQFPLAWLVGISIFEIFRRSGFIMIPRSCHYLHKIFLIPLVKNFTSLYSIQTRL